MALATRVQTSSARAVAPQRVSRRSVSVRAALDTSLVVGGSTVAMLALGRFAFMPFQRRTNSSASTVSGPKADTGDYWASLSSDASFIATSNDPAGFTIIDVFAWGALGHALGFALLAAGSSGTIPGVSGP